MEILKLKSGNSAKIIRKVIRFIKEDKVMGLPTDTVYGLVADATNKKAVERLFKIKKRKLKKPLPIFVKNIRMAKKLAIIDKEQKRFLKKSWPGKLTVILEKKDGEIIYGVNKKTIGLRVPKYKFINILIERINRPLTGTSANISGKPASTKIKEVVRQFRNQKYQPDLIIDAGDLPKSRPSKVIDFTGRKIIILRR